MRISIAGRFRPFSHMAGSPVLLPGSFLRCTAFPTRLVIEDLSELEPKWVTKIEFALQGPVADFTVRQDLENNRILIWGHYQEGFVRYCLSIPESRNCLELKLERVPEGGVFLSNCSGINKRMQAKEILTFPLSHAQSKPKSSSTRLSLGSHKGQEIEQIKRRADLVEIFPLWFRLGKTLCMQKGEPLKGGTLMLLEACRQAIDREKLEDLYQMFKNLFLAAFEGFLSPRLYDFQYQGLGAEPLRTSTNASAVPLNILTEGSMLIEKLFFKIEGNQAKILPLLLPEFHAGRMLNIHCGELGEVDLEWSKKTIRRMVFRAKEEGEIFFGFQKPLKTYRLRVLNQTQEKGIDSKNKGIVTSVNQPLHCLPGHAYFFDRFEK